MLLCFPGLIGRGMVREVGILYTLEVSSSEGCCSLMSKVGKDTFQICSGLESIHAFLYQHLVLCYCKSSELRLKPLPLVNSLFCQPSHILQKLLLCAPYVLLICFKLHVPHNTSLHYILSPPLHGKSFQLTYSTGHDLDLRTDEPLHGPESLGYKLSVVMFRCPDYHLCQPPVTLRGFFPMMEAESEVY